MWRLPRHCPEISRGRAIDHRGGAGGRRRRELSLTEGLAADVHRALDALHAGGPLGLAVSGGGDSTALLHLTARWAAARGVVLRVATVDHGLRSSSRAEADAVSSAAAGLGIGAERLAWTGWDGTGNLQARARDARRALLADWAREHRIDQIALGHTEDDQAETVLLRLMRGSGVDGLSAMRSRQSDRGIAWIRPLLHLRRAALREWLRAEGLGWIEDPSNGDTRFERARVREAMATLALDPGGLAATARRLSTAREVLEDAADALAARAARIGRCGTVHLAMAPMRAAREETRTRLLARAIRAVTGRPYPPRRAGLEAIWSSAPTTRSLHGCLIGHDGETLWLAREPAALEDNPATLRAVWHWRQSTPGVVAPLGEAGLRALKAAMRAKRWAPPPGWAEEPRPARATTPALWRDNRLACAPIAAYGDGLWAVWSGTVPGADGAR